MKRKDASSLSYLQDYGSSESEEEAPAAKSQKRLPVPNLPTYKACKSILREPQRDNTEKKIRSFPHEPGNWASYAYIPINANEEMHEFLKDLSNLLSAIDLVISEDFHISVTRTVVLRHHWIKDFTESISEVISSVKPFFINLSGFKVYLNENKTRTFLSLRVREGSRELNEIVKMLDECLASYKLPPFYKPASFHMSLLWCIGDKSEELKTLLGNIPKNIENFNIYEKVSFLKCNCGNKSFKFHLKAGI